jgi:hypothetical protein
MKLARTIATAAAVTVGTLGLAAPAEAAPLETSRATDRITTDMTGKVIIRVKYRDYGYLGVKPVKVCAHDNPDSLSRTIRVTFRYNGWTAVNMGEYKAGTGKCKRIPLSKQRRTTDRRWDASGVASVWRIGPVDVFSAAFYAKGNMR